MLAQHCGVEEARSLFLLLDQVLKFVGLVKGDHRIFDGDGAVFSKLPQSAGYRFAGGTCH